MLQLNVKPELASLTGDRGEQNKIALGVEHVSAREKRNPSGHSQEIDINTFTAFTDSQVVADLKTFSSTKSASACVSDMETKLHLSLPFNYEF